MSRGAYRNNTSLIATSTMRDMSLMMHGKSLINFVYQD